MTTSSAASDEYKAKALLKSLSGGADNEAQLERVVIRFLKAERESLPESVKNFLEFHGIDEAHDGTCTAEIKGWPSALKALADLERWQKGGGDE